MNPGTGLSNFVPQPGSTQQVLAQRLLKEHGWNVVQVTKPNRYSQDLSTSPTKNLQDQSPGSNPVTSTVAMVTDGKNSVTVPIRENRQEENGIGSSSLLSQRLKRGISNTMNNVHIVNITRELVLCGIKEKEATIDSQQRDQLNDSLNYTFILPDINHYSSDFKAFLYKDLIETSTLVSLEQAGRLNWWYDIRACQRLLPLATTGDGNCLLHAASLGIWGFHDRRLTLRKALCHTLTEGSATDAFRRRWRWNQAQINKQSGLIYSEQEWSDEWSNLLKLASPQPRTNGNSNGDLKDSDDEIDVFYESLEELHVFVLAHVLCRPIIIVADTILKDSNGDALAPILFGGIYLPLECDPVNCYRTPLLLSYDSAHFSAIVPMENNMLLLDDTAKPLAAAIPLVDSNFHLLPTHFLLDPGEGNMEAAFDTVTKEDRLEVLQRYLDMEYIPLPKPQNSGNVLLGKTKAGSWNDLVRTSSIESEDNMAGMTATLPGGQRHGSIKDKTKNRTLEDVSTGEKTKNKLPRYVQSVAESFGSLGRSFRKKLKRNFVNISKVGKQSDKLAVNNKRTVDGICSLNGTDRAGNGRDQILCAKLLHRRQAFQEEMVKNYLKSAEEKYELERKKILTQKLESGCPEESEVTCVNTGCSGMARASTSYLCLVCYERQKQEELDIKGFPRNESSPAVERMGIERVESGPSLPRYSVPKNIQASQVSLPPTGKPQPFASPMKPATNRVSERESVNTARIGSAGHESLTIYREGAFVNSQSSNVGSKPLIDNVNKVAPLNNPSSTQKTRSNDKSTQDIEAKKFEAELENSLYNFQKSVVEHSRPNGIAWKGSNLDGDSPTKLKKMSSIAGCPIHGSFQPNSYKCSSCYCYD